MVLGDIRDLLFASDVGSFGLRWRLWSARRASTTRIGDLGAAVGRRAKVVGVAHALDSPIPAPFTQRPSLAWRTKLDETRRYDDGTDDRVGIRGAPRPDDDPFRYRSLPVTPDWRTWVLETKAISFAVEDETGRVVVDARHAVLSLPYEVVDEHASVNDENAALREYLSRHGVTTTMYMGMTGNHRFLEAILRPGDQVCVWGQVLESTGVAAAGYRDVAARATIIGSSLRDPCVIYSSRTAADGHR
jgi:hypothetical protein